MDKIITPILNFLSNLESRTILTAVALGLVLFVPDVREFVVDLGPESIEETKTLEGLLILLIIYFRKNTRTDLK